MTSQFANPLQQEQQKTFVIVPQQFSKINLPKKVLVLDSGTLINLSMNGLLYILEELKKNSSVRFLITQQVKYETLDRPLNIPRFELGALRIKSLISNKTIELPEALSVFESEIKSKTDEFMNLANQTVNAKGRWIKIVSDAEMSCLALSSLLAERGIESMIAVDERTTRVLSENPENLEKLMSKRLHIEAKAETKHIQIFKQFKFIRSTELVYVAYKKNILNLKGQKALEAVLYATKFKGSSVSYDEIDVLKKL